MKDLEKLPIIRKTDLIERQKKYPPYGGFLAIRLRRDLAHARLAVVAAHQVGDDGHDPRLHRLLAAMTRRGAVDGGEDFLEQILEAAVIRLEDRVLG